MKFKMAATAGLSLTLDSMGKMFQNASSLKPNCPGMIIGRSSVFYADRKSKMAATTGHSINTGPYRENTEISSSLKLLHWLNLNCASIIGRSFTNFVFFMLIVIPRWLPLQEKLDIDSEESYLHGLNIICDTDKDNDDFCVDFMDEEDNWRDVFLLSEREC